MSNKSIPTIILVRVDSKEMGSNDAVPRDDVVPHEIDEVVPNEEDEPLAKKSRVRFPTAKREVMRNGKKTTIYPFIEEESKKTSF